jgi:hypothetical protein
MKPIVSSLIILLGMFSAVSCCKKQANKLAEKELMATDSLFSVLSAEQGMQKAFLANFDSSVVLLRSNKMPLTGIAELKQHFKTVSDTAFILTWKPLKAIASDDGTMGYTYGIYEIRDKSDKKRTESGTYITIWKRMGNGKWKATFDAGNEGIGDSVQKEGI